MLPEISKDRQIHGSTIRCCTQYIQGSDCPVLIWFSVKIIDIDQLFKYDNRVFYRIKYPQKFCVIQVYHVCTTVFEN